MKTIFSLIISMALAVSGLGQTRNVLVGTNNAVVQPTNFWSADASNARTGLGLGSAATNDGSAFQPASSVLSNLVSGGALTFSNITVGISNVTGLQSALDGKLGTNPTLAIGNVSNLQTTLDGKLGTNPTLQISNIAALQTALDGKLSGTFPIAISNVSGLQTSLDGKLSTNPTLGISNISGLQTNLDSKLSITGNAVNLTNFPASLLRTTGDASGLTNFPTLNQNTTGTASNVTGVVAIANGGTGTNSAIGARQNLGLVWTGLTNANAETFRTGLGATTVGGNIFTLANPSAIRFLRLNADNTVSALSDSDFRNALGLGSLATNSAAFQPASTVLSNLASSNGANLTNIAVSNVVGALATNGNGAGLTNLTAANVTGTVALASNVTGTIAISNGGSGATTAGGARTNLGLGATNIVQLEGVVASAIYSGTNTTNDIVLDTQNWTIYAQANQVFYWDTNFVNFNVPVQFNNTTNAAITRTNLGLGWSALTNTTASGFQTALFGTGTNPVLVNTNGEVVSPTNFWQAAPITTVLQNITNVVGNATNAATNARMLFLYSLAPTVTNVTSTITLPTNGSTFGGDVATITHLGPTNSVTAIRALGASTNIIALNQVEESVRLIYRDSQWKLMDNISYIEPIFFSGTNASVNAAASRTNLGLGDTNSVAFFQLTINGNIIDGSGFFYAGNLNSGLNLEEGWIQDQSSNNVLNWGNSANLEFGRPLDFGTNVAITRTNLGLGATWLTNTNVTNFRTAIELGATNNVVFSNVTASGTLTSTGVVTALSNAVVGGTLTATGSVTALSNVAVTGTLTATSTVTAKTNLVVDGFVDYTAARTNNTPTNTPNFAAHAAWIEVKIGTNSFFLPAYQ